MVLHYLSILFLTSVGIQCFSITLLLIAFHRKRSRGSIYNTPLSVIVAAHNEEQNLKELMPLLLSQDYPHLEVIIVEDRCNDNTFDFLLEETKKDSRLKMVRVVDKPAHISGKKFALTLGIRAATYEWVLLTDADCRPNTNQWVREMSSQCDHTTELVLGYSPYLKSDGLLNSFIRYESLLAGIQYVGLALLGRPYMGVGRNLAYRKSLFLQNKGFYSHLGVTGGDDDLLVNQFANKNNTGVVYGSDAMVISIPKLSWSEFYIQKIRHLSVGKYYKNSDKLILGSFSFSMILSWLLIIPLAMMYTPLTYWVLGVFVIRWIGLTILTHKVSRKLGYAFEGWKTPFLDFIFAIYYLVMSLIALQTKKIRWKKT